MNKSIVDSCFGELHYDYMWIKIETIQLFGHEYKVEIDVEAFEDEIITEKQQKSYNWFKSSISVINEQIDLALGKYVKEFAGGKLEKNVLISHDYSTIVLPKSVFFSREGNVVIMMDASWDIENGIGVQVYPDIYVDVQDEFI